MGVRTTPSKFHVLWNEDILIVSAKRSERKISVCFNGESRFLISVDRVCYIGNTIWQSFVMELGCQTLPVTHKTEEVLDIFDPYQEVYLKMRIYFYLYFSILGDPCQAVWRRDLIENILSVKTTNPNHIYPLIEHDP